MHTQVSLRHIALRALCIVLSLIAAGCGGGGDDRRESPANNSLATSADISLLFMGNSHSSVNNLPGMVAAMVSAVRPGKSVSSVEAPGWMFLEARLQDAPSMSTLRSQRWSAVVLQAQKYSTSGLFSYSTAEAEELIRVIRSLQSAPIMFPEWPRREVNETLRIYDLHVSIAQKESACVAPVGQAWDLALARYPSIVLHADDGNHSAPAGAFLAALILFATMTAESPLSVPNLPQFGVDAATQTSLREIAAETVATVPPRQWCASDTTL